MSLNLAVRGRRLVGFLLPARLPLIVLLSPLFDLRLQERPEVLQHLPDGYADPLPDIAWTRTGPLGDRFVIVAFRPQLERNPLLLGQSLHPFFQRRRHVDAKTGTRPLRR